MFARVKDWWKTCKQVWELFWCWLAMPPDPFPLPWRANLLFVLMFAYAILHRKDKE